MEGTGVSRDVRDEMEVSIEVVGRGLSASQ